MIGRAVFVALAFAVPLGAQTLLWSKTGQRCSHRIFGNALVLGDLNGDGADDFATGVEIRPPCGVNRKEIWTWSGRDGTQVGTPWVVNYTWSEIKVRVIGDVDGDGFRDFAGYVLPCNPTCAPMGRIEVHSGRDRRFLWAAQGDPNDTWGNDFAGDIDVNGDGIADVVICAYRANNFAGAVYVHEGRTGRELYRVNGAPGVTQYLGYSVAKLGDLDGDGCEDFVVGCGHLFPVQSDAVVVISGRTGIALRIGVGDMSMARVFNSVTGCGDVDRDGVPDFAGAGYGGVVMYSGSTGAILHRIRPFAGTSYLGNVLRGGQDLDQDGVPDVVAGADQENSGGGGGVGRVYAFSGRDGSTLWVVRPVDNYSNNMGTRESVALLAPQPGNPFPLVVIEESAHDLGICAGNCLSQAGLFRVVRSSPPGVDAYGSACGASGVPAPRIGIRTVPNGIRLTVAEGPAGGLGVLMLGTSRTQYGGVPLPIALDVIGLRGCLLQTSIDLTLAVPLGQSGMDRGYAQVDLPATLSATGSARVFAQWLVLGGSSGAPVGVTQALALSVQ